MVDQRPGFDPDLVSGNFQEPVVGVVATTAGGQAVREGVAHIHIGGGKRGDHSAGAGIFELACIAGVCHRHARGRVIGAGHDEARCLGHAAAAAVQYQVACRDGTGRAGFEVVKEGVRWVQTQRSASEREVVGHGFTGNATVDQVAQRAHTEAVAWVYVGSAGQQVQTDRLRRAFARHGCQRSSHRGIVVGVKHVDREGLAGAEPVRIGRGDVELEYLIGLVVNHCPALDFHGGPVDHQQAVVCVIAVAADGQAVGEAVAHVDVCRGQRGDHRARAGILDLALRTRRRHRNGGGSVVAAVHRDGHRSGGAQFAKLVLGRVAETHRTGRAQCQRVKVCARAEGVAAVSVEHQRAIAQTQACCQPIAACVDATVNVGGRRNLRVQNHVFRGALTAGAGHRGTVGACHGERHHLGLTHSAVVVGGRVAETHRLALTRPEVGEVS